MKILHFNANITGGSFAYASSLSKALLEEGHESSIISRDLSDRPWSDKFLRRGTLSQTRGAWHGTRRTLSPPNSKNLEGVDVVHLHTVADWFDVPRWLGGLSSEIKVVAGLHDLWHFSGGCFVYKKCEKFADGCRDCPLLHFPASRFLAHQEFLRKAKAYQEKGVHFVANSEWLASLARRSAIVGDKKISVVPPPLDVSIFQPQGRDQARALFNLKSDEVVVATGCASLTDSNKNTTAVLQALASVNHPQLKVIVFGEGEIPIPAGLDVILTGPVQSKPKLAQIYCASDLFVSGSGMETYGLTLVESQACGTPVVAFRVGGIPEAVPEGEFSTLCDSGDMEAFAQAVKDRLENRVRIPLEDTKALARRGSGQSAARKVIDFYRTISPKPVG